MMSAIHAFEKAGLGKAPFRFIRYEEHKFCAAPGAPILPGSSCDYCGTAIMGVYIIRSADGREFKVGCDCVAKTGDTGLIDLVKREANRMKTEARHAREAERINAARTRLSDPAIREVLVAQPHPYAQPILRNVGGEVVSPANCFNSKTRLDWAEWMIANAGAKGRIEVARYLESL